MATKICTHGTRPATICISTGSAGFFRFGIPSPNLSPGTPFFPFHPRFRCCIIGSGGIPPCIRNRRLHAHNQWSADAGLYRPTSDL